MPPLLTGLLAGLACLLVFAALGMFNSPDKIVTLKCSDGSKPIVTQVSDGSGRYTKVTCR